jgi:hypothetical protein
MTEQELLVDCLRRLNRAEITYYLTGSIRIDQARIPQMGSEPASTSRTGRPLISTSIFL